MTITDWVRECHELARQKGFWSEEPRNVGEALALVHSELSEALEEYRAGHSVREVRCGEKGKPEGFPVELADVLIRVFDLCGGLGILLERAVEEKHEFNRTRLFRHGKVC